MTDYDIPEAAIALIREFEGLSLTIYKDSAGKDSVGIGHFVKDGEDFSDGITEDQAEELLRNDLQIAARGVYAAVTRTDLNDNQLSALLSFCFNLGVTRLLKSTMLQRVNDSKDDEVPDELNRWIYAGEGISAGLVRRRKAEGDLYSKPV